MTTSVNNSSSINDAIHSEVSSDKSAEMARPKIQNSTSSRAIKKSVSSDRGEAPLLCNNTSRRKTNLEKLMKDTEKLAPKYPSLSQ